MAKDSRRNRRQARKARKGKPPGGKSKYAQKCERQAAAKVKAGPASGTSEVASKRVVGSEPDDSKILGVVSVQSPRGYSCLIHSKDSTEPIHLFFADAPRTHIEDGCKIVTAYVWRDGKGRLRARNPVLK